MQALRARRQASAAASAGGDPQVAALEAENARLRELVSSSSRIWLGPF